MSKTQVTTGAARLSYANIWEPRPNLSGIEKYSSAVLIPKSDKATIKAIEVAIEEAFQIGLKTKFDNKKAGVKLDALKDGDEVNEDGEGKGPEFKGMMYLNASANKQPIVLDRDRNQLLDKTKCYSGVWANVALNFYPFAASGNKGVAVGLEAIRVLKDDEPLGGILTTESAKSRFEEVDEDDI